MLCESFKPTEPSRQYISSEVEVSQLPEMFPDKHSAVRRANIVWGLHTASPILFIFGSIPFGLGEMGLDPTYQSLWLPFILAVSMSDIVIIFYFQFGKKIEGICERRKGILGGAYQQLSVSSRLSMSLSIYGFVLTLFSGMLIYVLAYSAFAWVLLVWVRMRFDSKISMVDAPS